MIASDLRLQGQFLFRHRSYIPVLLTLPLSIGLVRTTPVRPLPPSHEWIELLCFGVSVAGLVVRAVTVGFVPGGTSGRNTKQQRAFELNSTGLYSVVRHPLYIGNFLIWLGIALNAGDFGVVGMFVAAYWLYYERIMSAEEAYLAEQFGPEFHNWAELTPAFVPDPSRWQRPALPFSLRTVLRREYCAVLGVAVAFTLVDLLRHALAERRLFVDVLWIVLLAMAAATFCVLRWLKKKTRVLHVAGR